MIRVIVFVRDMIIALALGWIGVTIQPAAREQACPLKGPLKGADAAMCAPTRTPGFRVAGAPGCTGD